MFLLLNRACKSLDPSNPPPLAARTAKVVACGILVIAPHTYASESPDFDTRLQQLQIELEQIKTTAEQSWQIDREDIQALIRETQQDSRGRISLLQDKVSGQAGYDGKMFIANEDGSFRLNIGLYSQARFVHNARDTKGTDDDSASGFELRRTRIYLTGNAFGQDLKYDVVVSFSTSTGAANLSTGALEYRLNDEVSVRWGQFFAPFLYEQLMSSSRQLAVDRSYVNSLRTIGRTQGVQLQYEQNNLRLRGMWNDGAAVDPAGRHADTDNTPWNTGTTEWAFTARADVLLQGDSWKQFADYTSWADDPFAWMVGGAVHIQKDGVGTATAEFDTLQWTADTAIEFGGANLAASIVGAHFKSTAPAGPTYDQVGGVIQGGFFVIPDEWEIFARYEWFDFDGATKATTESDFSAITAGFNWFFQKHNLKWTNDIVIALDPVPDDSTGLGLLEDVAGADEQIVIRSQLTMRF